MTIAKTGFEPQLGPAIRKRRKQLGLTLQALSLGCLLLAGSKFELGTWFQLGLLVAAGCYAWEFWYTRSKDRMRCFRAFLHNHWAGLAIFVGIVLDYALR